LRPLAKALTRQQVSLRSLIKPTESFSMGHLSSHVLDTMHGCPAAGMKLTLQRIDGAQVQTLRQVVLNRDGRSDGGALLDAAAMAVGRYRLLFEVGAYFRGRGVALPEPAFIDTVPVDFGIADAAGDYHVPLLVSPWAYSTYRGS
jgi:5-hydroxyisourate hydrolase